MISSRKGSSSVSDSPDRLLPSGTTITGVNWLEPSSVSKCVCARQINCGTSADGISDPAGSVSVRLRVHPLAGVHDGCTLIYVGRVITVNESYFSSITQNGASSGWIRSAARVAPPTVNTLFNSDVLT